MDIDRKWLIGIVVIAVIGFSVLGFANRPQKNNHSNTLAITASFYPMAEFTRQVGGNRVAVTTIVKPGIEPHDYDPSPQDLAKIYSSKMLVWNGAGMEPWATRITDQLAQSNVMSAEASYNLTLLSQSQSGDSRTTPDPHVWLDPVLASEQVDAIRMGLIAIDPRHALEFTNRAAAYITKLKALDQDFRDGLAQCRSRDIVTSHQALNYIAKRYNLNIISIAGFSPDDEPSPQKLAEVADFARSHDVTHIFFETLVSPKLSQTIAREVGAETIVFNPLEGLTEGEQKAGKDYISVQKENLHNLQIALGCTT